MGQIDKKYKNLDKVTGTGQEVTGTKRWVRSHCLHLPMVGSGCTVMCRRLAVFRPDQSQSRRV